MTNKKFKKAAMALALTACVAAAPLAANAETPENAADVQAPAAVDHTEADTQEAPEAELPVEEEPEAQPAAEAAAQPAAPEATPIAVELPTAEETPEDEEAPEEKEETPVEVTPTEDAVVEKETPAKVAPAPAKADVDNLIEDPDADIATMDGAENAVNDEYEAKIGDTSYGTLQGAIDSAKDGDEVVLQKHHKGNIKIAEWIKLNLNGKKIEGNVDVDLSGKKDDAATTQDGETAVDKKVEIVDGTITGSTTSGVTIKDAEDTNVLLKDLTIEDNTGKKGGGVHIENSQDVTIDHCTIQGNEATLNGGGIYAKNSTVTVIGGSISGNNAAGSGWSTSGGGGVYAEGGSTVNLKDVTVSDNHVTGNYGGGGGIKVNDGKLTVDNAKILENTTNSSGGGISVKNSDLTVTDSEIRNNVAGGQNGGGVEIIGSATDNKEHTITDTQITGNRAEERGGGVFVNKANITIKDSTLDKNHAMHVDGSQASSEGGGLGVMGGKDITLDNTKVTNNSAKDGGGIWVRDDVDTAVTIKNGCVISGNKSVYGGGGIFIRQDYNKKISASIENALIENNSTENGGGIYLIRKVGLTLKDTRILGNNATNGGGIFAYDGSTINADNATVSGNKAAHGGGLYLWNTSGSILADLRNSFIENNTATGWGGGIFTNTNVKVNANNTKFQGNTAAAAGGILLWNNSSATLNNTEVSGNKATGNGGGVSVYDATCSLTTSNGTVFRENSGYRGGGIFSSGGTVTAEDSTFEKNTAAKDGGAIAATQNSSLTVRSSKVLENTSGDKAGGILAEKSTLEVTDSIVDGNRASVGGGLYIADIDAPGETKEDKPEHTITRTEITNNTADGQGIGGGIYLGAQKLTITDSKLTGNNTISKNGQTQGGAIVAYSPGDFTLNNTLIQGNTADVGGGIHVLSTKLRDSHIILCNNTRITGNVANLFGGGIFLDNMNNPAVLELVNASVDNNTANVAGGIGNYGSIVVLKDGAVLENNTAKQYGGGLYNKGKVTVESGAIVMNNTASTYGGGLYNKGEAIVESGAKLYNNHAALAGDDIYLAGKGSTLTLTKVGDDWMLDDCGHKINGWFADLLDARWDADGKQEHVINLKDYAADGLTIVENNEDGSFTITILDENATLALKAAHNVIPKPTPEPDPEPTPTPGPVTPETPENPPVEDATPDEPAETPVTPENPETPPVQDAIPDTVAALPKTGVNWFTALAMALSGMALMAAGAFTSLFAKSKH